MYSTLRDKEARNANSAEADKATSSQGFTPLESPNTQQNRPQKEASQQRGRSKRRRAALACNSCRSRKSRCDGARPKCSMCQHLAFDCKYQPSSSYKNVIVGKEYFAVIESRLKMIEDRLDDKDRLDEKDCPFIPSQGGDPKRKSPLVCQADREGSSETACLAEDENLPEPEDAIDGMGAVTFEPDDNCAYFGASSNIALIRKISQTISRLRCKSQPWIPTPATICQHTPTTPSTPQRLARSLTSFRYSFSDPYKPSVPLDDVDARAHLSLLPSETLSQELIWRYFANTGQLFPFLHRKMFLARYDEMKQDSSKGVKRAWLGLLNMVFAMAASVSLSSEGTKANSLARSAESDMYFQRGTKLCQDYITLGKGMNLDTLHYLLLTSLYLQGTQKSAQAWVTLGLAIRVAMQLGLHSSEASNRYALLEREIRNRTWYTCILLDRTLSMTFGRPPAIHQDYAQIDLPVPYCLLSPESDTDKLDQMSVQFFDSTILLYSIMATAIERLYGQNLACGPSLTDMEVISQCFNLEKTLNEWRDTFCYPPLITSDELPHAITEAEGSIVTNEREAPPGSVPSTWWPIYELRLRTIITLRFNSIRLLIHRPALERMLTMLSMNDDNRTGTEQPNVIRQMGCGSVQVCTQSAIESINIISAVVHSTGPARGLLGAWWFTLYYTFNAALILVSCALLSIQSKDSGSKTVVKYRNEIEGHLHTAITVLRDLDGDNPMTARCRHYLEQLVQMLELVLLRTGSDDVIRQEQAIYSSQITSRPYMEVFNVTNEEQLLGNNTSGVVVNQQAMLGIDIDQYLLDSEMAFLDASMNSLAPTI